MRHHYFDPYHIFEKWKLLEFATLRSQNYQLGTQNVNPSQTIPKVSALAQIRQAETQSQILPSNSEVEEDLNPNPCDPNASGSSSCS